MVEDVPENDAVCTVAEIQAAPSISSQLPVATYAFLNHSQDTLPNNLSPDVDNKPLARQKRRRTSPDDQAILEAAYQEDPKPDKAARLELVSRVALGEKEVQIWFQNRRQNSRRKSRPLLPHEIQASLQARLLGVTNAVDLSRGERSSSQDQCAERLGDGQVGTAVSRDMGQTDLDDTTDASLAPAGVSKAPGLLSSRSDGGEEEASRSRPSSLESISDVSQVTIVTSQRSSGLETSFDTALTELSTVPSQTSSQTVSRIATVEVGYLANRRSAPFVNPIKDTGSDSNQNRSLKRVSSMVRLSMTAEGNAKVVTNDDLSPSPPRSQPLPPPPKPLERNALLHRSYSSTTLPPKLTHTEGDGVTPLSGRAKGRSRDSRAWEFWCDSDARNALADKADQDQAGSAAIAIELMRSTSRGSSITNPNKRNKQLQRQSSAKRIKADAFPVKPGLSRAQTSLSRLQSDSLAGSGALTAARSIKLDKLSRLPLENLQSFNDDSDKENWEPGTRVSGQRRRRTQQPNATSLRRRVLGESGQIPSENSSLGTMMAREKVKASMIKLHEQRGEADKENGGLLVEDDEVARFMAQDRPGSGGSLSSVSGEEELDCVQGLLSLSQGNWR